MSGPRTHSLTTALLLSLASACDRPTPPVAPTSAAPPTTPAPPAESVDPAGQPVDAPASSEPRFACFEPGGMQKGDGTCPVSAICEQDDSTLRRHCSDAKDPCSGAPFTCACAAALCGSEGFCISAKVEAGGRHVRCLRPGI